MKNKIELSTIVREKKRGKTGELSTILGLWISNLRKKSEKIEM